MTSSLKEAIEAVTMGAPNDDAALEAVSALDFTIDAGRGTQNSQKILRDHIFVVIQKGIMDQGGGALRIYVDGDLKDDELTLYGTIDVKKIADVIMNGLLDHTKVWVLK